MQRGRAVGDFRELKSKAHILGSLPWVATLTFADVATRAAGRIPSDELRRLHDDIGTALVISTAEIDIWAVAVRP
jgi:hypothetical protein